MGDGARLLEVRCDAPGWLDGLPSRPTAADAPQVAGAVSVLTTAGDGRRKRIPTVYVSKAPVFAGRNRDELIEQTKNAVEMMVLAPSRPTYVLTPCEIAGKRGLYGKDVFNRSAFRRLLTREGVTFSGDIYVVIEEGVVRSGAWGDFVPEFVILPDLPEGDDEIARPAGAWLVFELSTFRIGSVRPDDVRALVSLSQDLVAVGGADAGAIARAVGQRIAG